MSFFLKPGAFGGLRGGKTLLEIGFCQREGVVQRRFLLLGLLRALDHEHKFSLYVAVRVKLCRL